MPRKTRASKKLFRDETDTEDEGAVALPLEGHDPEEGNNTENETDNADVVVEVENVEQETAANDQSIHPELDFASRVYAELARVGAKIDELGLWNNEQVTAISHRLTKLEFEQGNIYKLIREDHIAMGISDKRISDLEKGMNNINIGLIENGKEVDDCQQGLETEKIRICEKLEGAEQTIKDLLNVAKANHEEIEKLKEKSSVGVLPKYREEKIYLRQFNEKEENPMQFVDDVNKLIKLRPELETWERLYPVLDKALSKVDNWWNAVKGLISSFQEFKDRFKKKYFNKNIQRNFMIKIRTGRYDPKKETMSAYFVKNISIMRNLDTRPPDDEIIQLIVAHYPVNIKEAIVLQKIRTIDEVEEILQELDDLGASEAAKKPEPARRVSFEPRRETPPWQNRVNFQKGWVARDKPSYQNREISQSPGKFDRNKNIDRFLKNHPMQEKDIQAKN